MKNLADFAKNLKDFKFTKIAAMVGAGISVNAGIPDFRSKSGLYSRISTPELIFDIHHFRKNPQDFYDVAPKIIMPKASPTLTHYFLSYLEHLNILQICYSQNIDGLEKKAGVSKVVQAHGNTEKAHCSVCYKKSCRKELVLALNKSKPIFCECGGPIKPDVVFFGEMLPVQFEENLKFIRSADLLLIIGTSLLVRPFSLLAEEVCNIPRVLINNVNLASFKNFDRKDDLLLIGDTDDIVTKIIVETGWKESISKKYFLAQNNQIN